MPRTVFNPCMINLKHPYVVFQALTVLEYLVAHGSERVIDEIREHSYQISVISIPQCHCDL